MYLAMKVKFIPVTIPIPYLYCECEICNFRKCYKLHLNFPLLFLLEKQHFQYQDPVPSEKSKINGIINVNL